MTILNRGERDSVTSSIEIKPILAQVAASKNLSEEEAIKAFDIIMSGDATAAQVGSFLMGLRMRGESVTEITTAARILRNKAITIDAPANTIDTCGTGGDESHSYNISTAVALIVAGCGIPVAKHGNRAISSQSGAADVLTALGVVIDCDISLVRQSLWETNMCFLMAPRHHQAMKHVGAIRTEIGFRSIFNLLGPLINPAGVTRQLVGVFSSSWVIPFAQVLSCLGAKKAWVVHGSDGLDEITTTGSTSIAQLHNGTVSHFDITPEELDLPRRTADELKGGDAQTNAEALRAVLSGMPGAYRDIVLLNAAAALVVADHVADLKAGISHASQAIDEGKAMNVLEHLIKITNRTNSMT